MSSEADNNVELTIRCAFQAVCEDVKVSCSPNWTILQLKQHLSETIPSKPAVKLQRLIFAGSCLRDEHTVNNVLQERGGLEGARVFHLACSTPQLPELRQRRAEPAPPTSASASGSGALGGPSSTPLQGGQGEPAATNNPYAAWAAYYAQQYSAQALTQQQGAGGGDMTAGSYAHAYADYYARYAAYLQQHQQYLTAAAASPQAAIAAAAAQQAAGQVGGLNQAVQADPVADGQVQQNGAANAAAAGVNIFDEEPGAAADMLERAYRGLRLGLLVFVVFVYSTLERFLAVMAVIFFVLFINIRRGQRRDAAAAEQRVRAEQQNNNNNNDGEPGEPRVPPPAPPAPEVRSGMQIFLSTCYCFVTTFFASLVPENPPPVNMN